MSVRYALLAIVATSGSMVGTISLAQAVDRKVLPIAPSPFTGTVGLTAAASTPQWPVPVQAPVDAPNVLVIMTDDVGFGATSAFGGPIPTPNLEALAREGARYNNFNTTAMCSPTRAALLTGRNSHAVGSGAITDVASGYPGYTSVLPRSAATVARILRDNGYSTAMFGKHHNIPRWEASLSGPFDHWPTGLGFEYFYGFIIGDTDQWHPHLFRNTAFVDEVPDDGATLDHLLVNDAIHWIHQQKATSPDKPFLLYLATGSAHGPHQAPADWIARFRGRFDRGWDAVRAETYARQTRLGVIPASTSLSRRPQEIPAWASLTPAERTVYAKYMEVFAAMIAYQDEQIGRLVAELGRMGQLDNTIVIYIVGDNGASGEGGPAGTFNEIGHHKNGLASRRAVDADLPHLNSMGGPRTQPLYPAGWAWAMGTPFQWMKQMASHLGGIRNGLVVRWPGRVVPSSILRSQFSHVSDVTPTILEVTGLPVPRQVDGVEQQAMTGRSLAYTFVDAKAPEPFRTQYFEMLGSRGIYKDGWFANTIPKRVPWRIEATAGDAWSSYGWQLYDLTRDYSQSVDLADRFPDKLRMLQDAFLEQARANDVLPIDDELSPNRLSAARRHFEQKRDRYVWWGEGISIAEDLAPSFAGTSFSVSIDLATADPAAATGALLARGSWFGGVSFYLKNGRPVALLAASERPEDQFLVGSPHVIRAGASSISFQFSARDATRFSGGRLCIEAAGTPRVCGDVPRMPAVDAGQGETLDLGMDTGVPVTADYPRGGRLPGRILRVEVATGK